MGNMYEGNLSTAGLKFAVVVSRFNDFLSKQLLSAALDALKRHNVAEDDIDIAWTPGSFEIPLVAKKLAASGRYNVVICLGVVIRGATPHFDYICSVAAKGIAGVSLETGVPAIFGIVTADNVDQAIERCGGKSNKGWQAAISAIEMANLMRALK